MQKINSLLERVSDESRTASSKSPTEAGPTDSADKAGSASGGAGHDRGYDHVDAINKLFAEFQFAYHNQFHKAFADAESLVIAKKYWLASLEEFPPQIIVAAAKRVIATQEYLPSISVMLKACGEGKELLGLPEARVAYREACAATSPKRDYHWSHEAVYFAGVATGWFMLANEPEQLALPLFSHHYEKLCRQVLRGEQLRIDPTPALPETTATPLDGEELQRRLADLKQELNEGS